jgi:hypothetical protein
MEMMRAIGAEWRRSPDAEVRRLTLYIVDPEVYMDLGSGRIDVAELLNCQDVRFWAEIATPSGGVERRLFQEDPQNRTLGNIAADLDISVENWEAEVTPPPDFEREILPLADKCGKKLEELGVVPGSTLHFRVRGAKRSLMPCSPA